MRSVAAGIGIGAGCVLVGQLLLRESRRGDLRIFVLKGQYYQLLGHAWDHETKDFKVIYRPLYHCKAAEGRFEAHTLASSHFSRFESKFQAVSWAQVPNEAKAFVLHGPFSYDPSWSFSADSNPLPMHGASHNRSGIPSVTRSHQPPILEHISEPELYFDGHHRLAYI
jgi:hypothetical protein